MSEKERYGTAKAWSEFFLKEDGFKVHEQTIQKRLANAGVIGKTARNRVGTVLRNAFYSESSVRMHCGDLLQDVFKANSDGFIMKDGNNYGTSVSLGRLLGISPRTLRSRLSDSIQSFEGKDSTGHVRVYYLESEVRRIFQDYLHDLPRADSDEGVIEVSGHTYRSSGSLSRLLGLSIPTILSRIAKEKPASIRGRLKGGQVQTFYLESEILYLCKDLLQDLPESDEDGFIELDGEVYGTIKSFARLLGFSYSAIKKSITSATPSISGKSMIGAIYTFYPKSEIIRLCQKVLEELPQTDADGSLTLDGKNTYRTIFSIHRELGVSEDLVKRIVLNNALEAIRARSRQGKIHDYYLEADVRELYDDRPQGSIEANEDGLVKIEGKLHGTIASLARYFGVSATGLKRGIAKSSLSCIQMRTSRGMIYGCYLVSQIREICETYLVDLPMADEDGFIGIDGEMYGSKQALSRRIGVHSRVIKRKIDEHDVSFIEGKNRSGRILSFYSESEVRELCQEDIQELPRVDENGLIIQGGKVYGTVLSLSRLYGYSRNILHLLVNDPSLLTIQGRISNGHACTFYLGSEVRELYSKYLAKKSKK